MKSDSQPSRHIVIDGRSSGTTTGRYVEKLVEYLAKFDSQNRYTILVWTSFLQVAPKLPDNFSYQSADYPLSGSLGEQTGLLKIIKSLRPDLVHFTMAQQPLFYRGKTITTIQDLTGVRFRNPMRSPLEFAVKSKVFGSLIKTAARRSRFIITPTEYVKEDLIRFCRVNPDKITVTYESADIINDAPQPVEGLAGKPFIMYIGRPTPHKNLERLIEAYAELQKTQPDLWLALAGKKDANYQRIETSVHERKLKNIIFTDYVSEGQLRWMYQNCRAYIFPSLSEGFGLPGLEAMAHGAPVVSSNATCLPEVYGEAAQYFDPSSLNSMVSAIGKVLSDNKRRSELTKLGKKQINLYSWQRMAEQTFDLYERALS